MVSNRQLEANRRNAELSTGPVTDEGKAIVSKNRVSHGVLSREVVLPGMEEFEKIEDFQQLKESMEDYWQPEGVMEEVLCEDLAIQWWRMRRLYRHESSSLKEEHESTKKFWYETRTEKGFSFSDIPKEVLGIEAHMDDLKWHKEWLDIVEASLKKRRKSLKLIFNDEDCLCAFSEWYEENYYKVEKLLARRKNIPYCHDDNYESFVMDIMQKAGVSVKELLEDFKRHLEYQIKDIEGKLEDKLHQYEMKKEQILPSTMTNESFLKYEASIRRNIEKDIKQIAQLQAFRTGAMFNNNRSTDD